MGRVYKPLMSCGGPVKSKLTSRYYTSPEIFRKEQQRLFESLWIFAGITDEASDDNAFFTRNIGRKNVLFVRHKGQYFAHENICPHRLTPLVWEEKGKRALVCRYHGWSFEGSGQLRKIPFEKESYQFTEKEKSKICLKTYALETVGKFLFVNLSAKPDPIATQFNPSLLQQLREISENFDSQFERRTFKRRFNWKLAYENLRDPIHVPFLHPTSLSKLTQFGTGEIPVRMNVAIATLRSLSYGGPDATIPNPIMSPWHASVNKWNCEQAYYNWLMYPNLHAVTATCGHSFSIEYHEPLSATETAVHVYFMTACKKDPSWDASHVLDEHYEGSAVILGEDYEALEKLQRGLDRTDGAPNLGAYEWLNIRVESWYRRRLGELTWSERLALPFSAPFSLARALRDYYRLHGLTKLKARLAVELSRWLGKSAAR